MSDGARRLPQGLEIRAATPDDRPAIIELCRISLGWDDDPRFEQLYAWKHDDNPFGASPTWVATDAGRIVGLRAFLRWEFIRNGQVLRAVRAVDTATHPHYQGKGLFTALTMHGLAELAADGVDFVFNTPNDKSRPGYLKMGWHEVGRFPSAMRFAGPLSALASVRSRTASGHWSLPLTIGEPFDAWLDHTEHSDDARPMPTAADALTTNVGRRFLLWRYGNALLGYRAVPQGRGAVIVRARRRGLADELVLLHAIDLSMVQADDVAAKALKQSGCNHCMRTGPPRVRSGFLPLPGGGPMLTFRALKSMTKPALGDWQLGMGDIELF